MSGMGVVLISVERQRQEEREGYTDEHDDAHTGEELAYAAAAYATPLGARVPLWPPSTFWPWELESFKATPEDRERELVKAGALIAAEIDRLRRARLVTDG